MASKLAFVVLLPVLALGALVLAVLSLWSVDAEPAPEAEVRHAPLRPLTTRAPQRVPVAA